MFFDGFSPNRHFVFKITRFGTMIFCETFILWSWWPEWAQTPSLHSSPVRIQAWNQGYGYSTETIQGTDTGLKPKVRIQSWNQGYGYRPETKGTDTGLRLRVRIQAWNQVFRCVSNSSIRFLFQILQQKKISGDILKCLIPHGVFLTLLYEIKI